MTTKYDVIDFLKKDYKKWSNNSACSDECIINHSRKLKTLPQAEWYERHKVIADLKAALPDISPRKVRRHCIPYHEAILLELEEQGYNEAFYYMREFINFDRKIAEKTTGTRTWKKICLENRKDFIDHLKHGLMAFEDAEREGDYVTRAMSLLDVALFFQSKGWEWKWVTERLYQAALFAAESIEDDELRTITLIRYLYGRFLFQELKNPKSAIDYLKEAREASEKKTWNASKILGERQRCIFIECNIILYKALLILARKERPENPDFALNACIEALERATDAGDNEYLTEVLYELGKSYFAKNDMIRALQSFSKFLAIAKRIPDPEGVCNGHMELAFTYKELGDDAHTEKHLHLCQENADNFDFREKLADSHYYIGEHYLSQGKLNLSTVHLETALCIYHELSASQEADRARCIAGISKGQEIIKEYYNILLQCGEYDEDATLKICRWKCCRKNFWAKRIEDIKSDLDISHENSLDTISSLLSV
ncbi:tetratricopeptide repeat protein 29 isoform X2 [Osmia lignaria lignaria]|uniref:tetratricopeptide repeat protein 29 isoform X2 n=1 Tax=Osmia lignaria lignaria TaxID=1437193 RepID=UPI001478D8BE|nr:uncharacterized protein LOC117607461 isoform X2 [Osmia lignaria]